MYKIFRGIFFFKGLLCLASRASSYLSTGPRDVGHKSVPTEPKALALQILSRKQAFASDQQAAGGELEALYAFLMTVEIKYGAILKFPPSIDEIVLAQQKKKSALLLNEKGLDGLLVASSQLIVTFYYPCLIGR